MKKLELYGIANCDSVKKARRWLDASGLEYSFNDYKKQGADPVRIEEWIAAAGLDAVLNRRGTTYRKLPDEAKADMTIAKAVTLLQEQPSMIKRPILEHQGGVLVGFEEDKWSDILL